MQKVLLVLLVMLTVLSASAVSAEDRSTNWQLILQYDSSGVRLLSAEMIPPTKKAISQPGLPGAALTAEFDLTWRDVAGRNMQMSQAVTPLGLRAPMEDGVGHCINIVPDNGTLVLRVTGPESQDIATSIDLQFKSVSGRAASVLAVPPALTQPLNNLTLAQRPQDPRARLDGPVTATKIRDTGPDSERLVLVVLGDGYTASNLAAGDFDNDVAGLEDAFLAKEPWNIIFDATNIYQVDIESNEEGADNEIRGVFKDTYLHSSFWTEDIERLLALPWIGMTRAVDAADDAVGSGMWDAILVLVNSTKYGGSGGYIAVSSVHSAASEVVLHELGHSYAGLADEYDDPYPGFPPGDPEPNVDYDFSGPGLKWTNWVEPSTPLPTPENAEYGDVVGAFEGARYLTSGIYRPYYVCLMSALGFEFCPVCRESHLVVFSEAIGITEGAAPSLDYPHLIDESGTQFIVTPKVSSGLMYIWSLDGVPFGGTGSSTFNLVQSQMLATHQTLAVTVSFDTSLMKSYDYSEVYEWTVSTVLTCCEGTVGNIDCDSEDLVDISDLTVLINHLFITFDPLCCEDEANVQTDIAEQVIDIGDLTTLIDHLFISFTPLSACP